MAIRTQNPATGEVVRSFDALSDADVDARLGRAVEVFRGWRAVPPSERSRMMTAAGRLLEEGRHTYARTMTLEMGKPIAAAVQEVEKCARACRFYAEHGPRFLADEGPFEPGRSFVKYQPLGAVLAVMPWNFPFWQV